MADKTKTSLTSHSLFPTSGDGLDLNDLSTPFSFAPALVPTSAAPVVQPAGAHISEEIALNPDVLEGEVEKFVGQPVTPPTTPRKSELTSPASIHQPSTPPTATSNVPSSSNLPYSIYSPMAMPAQANVSYQQSPFQPPLTTQTTPSKPVHAVPPFTPSQQSLFPPAMSSPMPPSAPPPTPEQRAKASPLRPHWFYLKHGKVWTPLSWKDSSLLQQSFSAPPRGSDRIVATDGGRFDVNIDKRTRTSVYWNEAVTVVRPCTWFCKAHDGENKLIPYEESIAARLEQAYLEAYDDQKWPKTVDLEKGETVIMHNSNVMVHFSATMSNEDEWSGEDIRSRPKVVRRGIDDFESDIDDGEPSQIDHLVFVVHGIGPYADLKFRSLIDCVNDFRKVSLEMMDGRREKLTRNKDNLVGRIEFLPVYWYGAVHDDMPTGVDRRLQSITINSVTKLREFTNNTLLDILFFTSPVYCQTIVDKVCSEMNRLLAVFQQRNPSFGGGISVCGHSLGTAICFDILQHQGDQGEHAQATKGGSHTNIQTTNEKDEAKDEPRPKTDPKTPPSLDQILHRLGLENFILTFQMEQIDGEALLMCSEDDLKELGIPMGPRKKIVSYQKEYAKEKETAKESNVNSGVPSTQDTHPTKSEKTDAPAPSTSSYRNLSQNPSSVEVVEILQYHHGRQGTAGTGQPYVRYPKLNFEPRNLFALGSPIGLFLTVRGVENIGFDYSFPTCHGFYNIFHPYDPVAYRVEPLIVEGFKGEPVLMQHHKGRKRMHLELRENLSRIGANLKQKFVESVKETWATINDFARAHTGAQSPDEPDSPGVKKDTSDTESQSDVEEKREAEAITMGCLNRGQRVDFVLQEKPIEVLNEYLFALSSHVCYWQSEDTALFMIKEIYKN